MIDDRLIYQHLDRRLGVTRPWGEALAMVAGCFGTLLILSVAGSLACLAVMGAFNRPLTARDGWTCAAVVASLVLLSSLLAWAQGLSLQPGTLDRSMETVGSALRPFSRYQGREAAAGGCLVSLFRFLGGNVIITMLYFVRRPPLSTLQLRVATSIVSVCLRQGETGVDRLHDAILTGRPELTELDFERAVTTLRQRGVLLGQSYVKVNPLVEPELQA